MVDSWIGERQARLELELARWADRTIDDHTDVGARAAHVERDHVNRLGEPRTGDEASPDSTKPTAIGLADGRRWT